MAGEGRGVEEQQGGGGWGWGENVWGEYVLIYYS